MDYKEKYLRLKQQIYQKGNAKRLNPKFVNELSNLAFVINDKILEDDVQAVIFSLIEKFNKISVDNDLCDN